jgi:hypothetical protein
MVEQLSHRNKEDFGRYQNDLRDSFLTVAPVKRNHRVITHAYEKAPTTFQAIKEQEEGE